MLSVSLVTIKELRESTVLKNKITFDELEYLRIKIRQAEQGYYFCDGCGICCSDDAVELIELEFQQISKYIENHAINPHPQSFLCPFLDYRRDDYIHNLKVYAEHPEQIKPIYCRIYEERPIVCRMFPSYGDHSDKECRTNGNKIFKSPDLYTALQDCRVVLDKYFFNIWWEHLRLPTDIDQLLDLKFVLMPGWEINKHTSKITFLSGSYGYWFNLDWQWWHAPTEYEYHREDLDILEQFIKPISYRELFNLDFDIGIEADHIIELLTQAEFCAIIGPADQSFKHMHRKFLNFAYYLPQADGEGFFVPV